MERLDIASFLIDYSADVNYKAYQLITPLMSATRSGRYNIAKFLIERGADIHLAGHLNRTLGCKYRMYYDRKDSSPS